MTINIRGLTYCYQNNEFQQFLLKNHVTLLLLNNHNLRVKYDKYIQFIGKATTYWVITYTLYKTHSIKILYKDRKGD